LVKNQGEAGSYNKGMLREAKGREAQREQCLYNAKSAQGRTMD